MQLNLVGVIMCEQKRLLISDSGEAIRLNPQVVRKMISEHIRISVSPKLKALEESLDVLTGYNMEESEDGINVGDNRIHGDYIDFIITVEALGKLVELYERTKGEGEEVDIRLSSDNI